MSKYTPLGVTYYSLLGLHPAASPIEIRRAYRKFSKRYHPDTTEMPKTIATNKFQQISEAYDTLANPEKRLAYDRKIRHLYLHDFDREVKLKSPLSGSRWRNSSSYYLDSTDRPLSGGELFALLIMSLALVVCLAIAITIGLIRPEVNIQSIQPPGIEIAKFVSPSLMDDYYCNY